MIDLSPGNPRGRNDTSNPSPRGRRIYLGAAGGGGVTMHNIDQDLLIWSFEGIWSEVATDGGWSR